MLLACPALRLGAGQQKLLDVASMAGLVCKLGGWMSQNYSMLTHVKTRGEKNSTPCAVKIPTGGAALEHAGATATLERRHAVFRWLC